MNIKTFFFTCLYNNGKQLEFLRRFPDLFILPANRINSLVRPCRLSVFSFTPKILQCLQLWREHNVPIFRHFKLSIHNYMDCNQFIQAFIFSLFHPLSCFFFSLTGQLVALYHLNVSLHRMYKPFLATTSSPASQERLLPTPSHSVLIFTRLGNTGRCQPWGDFIVLLGGERTPVLD